MTAVAISASGFIRFDGGHYIGECETTSDILGPLYRPNSPIRTNLRVKGQAGDLAVLKGYVRHDDCTTPYKNAKVELWHCDAKGLYDNTSPEFRYRGTTFTNEKGYYSFQTIMPVNYGGDGFVRPAHYHLIITAKGYKPLITQLYFDGDEHIKDDPYASSPTAQKRILKVEKDSKGITNIRYDVGMSTVLYLEAASIGKLAGKYIGRDDQKKTKELFTFENRLWMKNEAFGNRFEYVGNNTFEEANNPSDMFWNLVFNILPSGSIELTESYGSIDESKKEFVYVKA